MAVSSGPIYWYLCDKWWILTFSAFKNPTNYFTSVHFATKWFRKKSFCFYSFMNLDFVDKQTVVHYYQENIMSVWRVKVWDEVYFGRLKTEKFIFISRFIWSTNISLCIWSLLDQVLILFIFLSTFLNFSFFFIPFLGWTMSSSDFRWLGIIFYACIVSSYLSLFFVL